MWSTPLGNKKSLGLDADDALNETIHRLSMANSVLWYGHVLDRESGNVLWSEW